MLCYIQHKLQLSITVTQHKNVPHYAECRYAQCCIILFATLSAAFYFWYAECLYAKCDFAEYR
jgi:hypothetical protein